MDEFSPEQFDVDLAERTVFHKPSKIWLRFYVYTTEEGWQKSDSVTLRDNPEWTGDRMALAAAAKRVAIKRGMTATRPVAHQHS